MCFFVCVDADRLGAVVPADRRPQRFGNGAKRHIRYIAHEKYFDRQCLFDAVYGHFVRIDCHGDGFAGRGDDDALGAFDPFDRRAEVFHDRTERNVGIVARKKRRIGKGRRNSVDFHVNGLYGGRCIKSRVRYKRHGRVRRVYRHIKRCHAGHNSRSRQKQSRRSSESRKTPFLQVR